MKKLLSLIFVNLLFAVIAVSQSTDTTINAIQGDGIESPKVGTQVSTRGIVTAIIYKKGFYIQTPDAEVDKISKTSEGIYVFTKEDIPSEAVVGNLVKVSGKVAEFKPPKEKYTLKSTQIVFSSIEVISKGNPLPAPYILTATDLDPTGKIDQMERFEGMRVKINALTTTSGTDGRIIDEKKGFAVSDGIFYGVLRGTPRTFREPGIDGLQWLLKKMDKTLPVFDMNPEMLRIESYAQAGAKKIEVTADATVKNLTGIIDYSKGSYTLLVDANNPPTVEGNKSAVPVTAAKEREIMVASFNLENFFDEEINSSNIEKEIATPKTVFEGRLKKASLAIRNILSSPDVLGVIEVENLASLKKLADKINADTVEAKLPNPNYVAYLEEGNDGRGIDVGFLVKTSRVKVVEVKQLAKEIKFEKTDDKLFDRPSLMLRASVDDKGKPFEFTAIINHLKSFIGVDDDKDGERVQIKRRSQSEWLANFVQERTKENPNERIILCGDFNAFEFPDGYNDLIGTLKGKPSPNVVTPSKTIFNTGLVNLVETLQKSNRYSYIYEGNSQTLDHIMVNQAALKNSVRFGYARVDADFPVSYYNDYNRPERISDHDGAILYLSLDDNKK
jgi:uncharacterized protein